MLFFFSIFTPPLLLLRYDTPLTTSYHRRHEWEMNNMPNGNGLTHGMGIRSGTLCHHGKRLDLNNLIHEHIEGRGPHYPNLPSSGKVDAGFSCKFQEKLGGYHKGSSLKPNLCTASWPVLWNLFFFTRHVLGKSYFSILRRFFTSCIKHALKFSAWSLISGFA